MNGPACTMDQALKIVAKMLDYEGKKLSLADALEPRA